MNFIVKNLFVVKHKSSYSFESVIFFNLTTDIFKNNCNFKFYFNKTDITPTALDGGDEIVWPNNKHIVCNTNNDIPVKIPSHPYVVVNRNILCNCIIEADNHYLLESIAACNYRNSKLVLFFTINMAFADYVDMFPNVTESFLLIRYRTTHKQPLSIYLSIPDFNTSLLHASTNLKSFVQGYAMNKNTFDLEERHASEILNSDKNFFSNNYW